MKKLSVVMAVVAAAAMPVLADTYDVDPVHTLVSFGVKHMMVSTVHGKFDEFKGTLDYDPAKPDDSGKISAMVEVKSVNTGNAKRDEHLRSPDFFDAPKFPQIKFESTKLEKSGDGYVLHGKLTIKETTKDVAIPVSFSGPVEDPYGNTRLGFEGNFKINRKDYGLNFNMTLANGSAIVGEDVSINLSVEGIKRK